MAKRKKEKPAAPPLGFVRIESDDPHYTFVARLGDGSPTPKFDTGWNREKRPKRRSLTWWDGTDGLELEIPILFDHFISGDGVTCEAEIRQLEKMSGLEKDLGEPPLVAFNSGGLIPHDEHDASHIDWVVGTLDWGDAERNRSGNRIRQAVTVTLWEFNEGTTLSNSPAEKNRRHKDRNKKKPRGARHKSHHVQPGETLSTIARDELGDASRWREIAKKNPKHGKSRRDPKAVIPGETLKMP